MWKFFPDRFAYPGKRGNMTRLILAAVVLTAGYYPARFEAGFTYTAREAVIYAAPSDSSEAVVSVPPGELLEIVGFSGETFSADSCDRGWYQAGYRHNNTVYTGFVQDTNLAFTSLSLGPDTLFVFRLSGFNVADNAFEGEVSVIANGVPVSTQSYRPHWTPYGRMFDYDVTARAASPEGFSNAAAVIILYFGLDAPEVDCREDMLVWTTDGRLVAGPKLLILADSDTERYSPETILPTTPGGRNNMVTHNFYTEKYNSDTDTWEPCEDSTAIYTWTGEVFTD